MRLVMTLFVRDEEDILEANLRYHLSQGVDHFLVTDNGSADRTPLILERFRRAGRLRLWREEGEDHPQRRCVTAMARIAALEHGADWVINADADEFWWPVAGTLKQTLTAVPRRYGVVYAPRLFFLAAPGVEGFEPSAYVVRHAGARGVKAAHRAHSRAVVEAGNHSACAPGLARAPQAGLIDVLHFPFRGRRRFEERVRLTGRTFTSCPDFTPETRERYRARSRAVEEGTFDALYRELVASPDRVARGLSTGELVVDRRLASHLESGSPATGQEPGPEAVARMIGEQLAAAEARMTAADRLRSRVAATRLFVSTRPLRHRMQRARSQWRVRAAARRAERPAHQGV